MLRIDTVSQDDAKGDLREIYDEIIRKRGKIADVLKIQSLHPTALKSHLDLYMAVMFAHSPLTRAQREMIAVVVSTQNGCHYCQTHHSEALNAYWKNQDRVEALKRGFENLNLDDTDFALCTFSKLLTSEPAMANNAQVIEDLKKVGLSDRAILDATLVTSYFNFVNRIVLALGVDVESDGAKGYQSSGSHSDD